LPVPRSTTRTVMQEEDELEDEVKPKAFEIENAQKPPDKKKQPVKITIPSLDKTDLDEEENIQRKPTPSATKSGLFSLLPPPIHSAKKEINRPLIPHTLSKKPQITPQASSQAKRHIPIEKPTVSTPSSSSTKSVTTKKVALNIAMYGSDSDDDDDVSASNFFSLDSSSKSKSLENVTMKHIQSEEVSSSETSTKLSPSGDAQIELGGNNSSKKAVPRDEDKNEVGDDSEIVATVGPEPGALNDAPLDFGCTSNSKLWSSSSSSFSQGYLGAVGLAGPVASPQNSLQGYNMASASTLYNMVDSEVVENGPLDTVGDDDLKQFMSDKEFQRLSGKRKRGLEDAINFVDANVDDYVDPSEVSKHLTEETEYVSHKNKDNMPTAQQRRKKQITYLAYQAKERELELKNTWAQNRMTKKQTQSKYGF
ncbi:proline-rich protein PRCC-like, partial [Elysia marginata]